MRQKPKSSHAGIFPPKKLGQQQRRSYHAIVCIVNEDADKYQTGGRQNQAGGLPLCRFLSQPRPIVYLGCGGGGGDGGGSSLPKRPERLDVRHECLRAIRLMAGILQKSVPGNLHTRSVCDTTHTFFIHTNV